MWEGLPDKGLQIRCRTHPVSLQLQVGEGFVDAADDLPGEPVVQVGCRDGGERAEVVKGAAHGPMRRVRVDTAHEVEGGTVVEMGGGRGVIEVTTAAIGTVAARAGVVVMRAGVMRNAFLEAVERGGGGGEAVEAESAV